MIFLNFVYFFSSAVFTGWSQIRIRVPVSDQASSRIRNTSVVEPFHFGPAPAPASQDGGSGSGSSSSSSPSPLVNNLLLKKKFLQI